MPTHHAAKRWVFTLNNYTDDEQRDLLDNSDSFRYLVLGRERGDSGTPHLQGFFILHTRLRRNQVSQLAGLRRAHLEKANGTNHQAAQYCKKDGDFDERGEVPISNAGKRSDWHAFKEWVKVQEARPTDLDILENFPALYGRYKRATQEIVDMLYPRTVIVEGELRDWQRQLDDIINDEPDSRKVIFVVDPEGNKGKSWLVSYWMSHRDDVQMLSVGKRDDIAFSVNVNKRVFLFDVPRTQMEYLQYAAIEAIKNRVVYSPKYDSKTKLILYKPHVIVFCNEEPDRTKMSADRYRVMRFPNLN